MGNRFKYRKWQVSSQILPLMVPVPYSRQDSCSVSPPIMPMSVPRARSLQMFNKFPSKSWWKWQILHHQPCYFIFFSISLSFNIRPWMLEQKGQNISYLPFLPKKKMKYPLKLQGITTTTKSWRSPSWGPDKWKQDKRIPHPALNPFSVSDPRKLWV